MLFSFFIKFRNKKQFQHYGLNHWSFHEKQIFPPSNWSRSFDWKQSLFLLKLAYGPTNQTGIEFVNSLLSNLVQINVSMQSLIRDAT